MLGILLVAPIVITMVALVFYPLVQTVWDSLHRVNPMQPGTPFIGLANYTNMLGDAQLGTRLGQHPHLCRAGGRRRNDRSAFSPRR